METKISLLKFTFSGLNQNSKNSGKQDQQKEKEK